MRCRSIGMLVVTLGVPLLAVFWPLLTEAGKDSAAGSTGPNALPSQDSQRLSGPQVAQSDDPFGPRNLTATPSARATSRDAAGRSALPGGPANAEAIAGTASSETSPPTLAAAIARLSQAEVRPEGVAVTQHPAASDRLVPVSAIEEFGGSKARPIGAWSDQPDARRAEPFPEEEEAPVSGNAPSPALPPDRFTATDRYLRQLGATYCRLETYGDNGQQYRFQCRMPPSRGSTSPRDFDAVDAVAGRAMEKVLTQVKRALELDAIR